MRPTATRASLARTAVVIAAVLALGCESPTDAPIVDTAAQFAKGGGGPSVVSAIPSEGAQGSINLQVRITGSGFDSGSNAVWLRNGDPAPDVQTNFTTFVSKSELIADINIDVAALESLYDIEVTTRRGKKGVGVELFSVKKPGDVGPSYELTQFAGEGAIIYDVSGTDVLVGSQGGHAAFFDMAGNATQLPDLGGDGSLVSHVSPGGIYGVGGVWSEGQSGERALVWDLVTGTVTEVQAPPGRWLQMHGITDAGVASGVLVDQDVPQSSPVQAAIWEPDGPGAWRLRLLPLLSENLFSGAGAINSAGNVAGSSDFGPNFFDSHAVLWTVQTDGSIDVVDLTPNHDETGSARAEQVTEPGPEGTVLVAGYQTIAGERGAMVWTVHVATQTVTSVQRRVGTQTTSFGDGRMFGRERVLLSSSVWTLATDAIDELPTSGSDCRISPRAFDSSGRIFGIMVISTKKNSSCSSRGGKGTAEVAAMWTEIGG